MTGIIATVVNAAASGGKSGGSLGVAAGLPAGQNLVEGTEANLMVGAAAANSNWRKAAVALGAALITLIPLLGGIWFLYKAGGAYADYAVAIIVFGLGVHEIMEGVEDRPSDSSQPRLHALDGPLGIDPADPKQIRKFQSAHGLAQDGAIGPRTRGAILAGLHRQGQHPTPNRLGIDICSEESVIAFQRRVGLRPDGIIGPRTQGALAAESARHLPDPANPEEIRLFQRQHGLAMTGIIDARTQGALHVLDGAFATGSSDHHTLNSIDDGLFVISTDGQGADADGQGIRGRAPILDQIDLTDKQAVGRFQKERGLPETGVVDQATQGALSAEIAFQRRLPAFDPSDPVEVARFQALHGLAQTGIVDEATQTLLRTAQAPQREANLGHWAALGIDPTDPRSIERFQALHGLERSGVIDQRSAKELRRTQAWTAGINPTDPTSVARFQAHQGIEPTGEIDGETQGAMRAYRTLLLERYEVELPQAAPN